MDVNIVVLTRRRTAEFGKSNPNPDVIGKPGGFCSHIGLEDASDATALIGTQSAGVWGE